MHKKGHRTPAQVFRTPFLSQARHFLGLRTSYDSNMSIARSVGLSLSPGHFISPDEQSDLLWSQRDVAENVERLVMPAIMGGADPAFIFRSSPRLLGLNEEEAGRSLRVWSGCLSAAKIIAIGTRSGRNWPWWRRRLSLSLDSSYGVDPYFDIGAMSAVAFKIGREEPYSFLGIPRLSFIRRGVVAEIGRLGRQ